MRGPAVERGLNDLSKKVDAQLSHINSLRLVIGLLIALGLYMAYGWQSAPRDLTIHVPPDLRSGSTRQWWDVPQSLCMPLGCISSSK